MPLSENKDKGDKMSNKLGVYNICKVTDNTSSLISIYIEHWL